MGLFRTREFCSEPEKSTVGLLRTREERNGSAQNQRRAQWVCSEPEKSAVGLLRTRELYSCHCEALRAYHKMRYSINLSEKGDCEEKGRTGGLHICMQVCKLFSIQRDVPCLDRVKHRLQVSSPAT